MKVKFSCTDKYKEQIKNIINDSKKGMITAVLGHGGTDFVSLVLDDEKECKVPLKQAQQYNLSVGHEITFTGDEIIDIKEFHGTKKGFWD